MSPRISSSAGALASPPLIVGLAVFVFTFGVFLHYVSDAQKYYTLRLRKGLIREGLFSRMRNPNYLGEILIYLAYATLSMHWLPFLILAGWVFGFFVRNMIKKDRSLSARRVRGVPEVERSSVPKGVLNSAIIGRRPSASAADGGSQCARGHEEAIRLVEAREPCCPARRLHCCDAREQTVRFGPPDG